MSFLNNLFGGQKPAPSGSPNDAGFADFAGAPAPEPASISPVPAAASSAAAAFGSSSTGAPALRPYTKWYRVWERTSPADFYQEMFLVPLVLLAVVMHMWGTRTNRRKARDWVAAHAPLLQDEFAVVGFGGRKRSSTSDPNFLRNPDDLLRENAANEFVSYASGRQNVAFLDLKILLKKRYNPLIMVGEHILGFFFDSMAPVSEHVEATLYAFDGKENLLVPEEKGEEPKKPGNSAFDGFVFAVVNKNRMKTLRDERYDLSLTTTKDHPKLPAWATVMSESAEITDTCLTPDLIKAITEAGDGLEAFIVSDQPVDKPKKLQETTPRKRVFLSVALAGIPAAASQNLFKTLLRYPDFLASPHGAHFRPEVLRKVRATRDAEIAKIRKLGEDEKAEERKLDADRKKKEKRDRELRGLTAEEQKKYLEKEKEKEQRKSQKRFTMRG